MRSSRLPILSGIVIFLLVLFLQSSTKDGYFLMSSSRPHLRSIATAKGRVSYNDVNRDVFLPMGYKLIASTAPLPILQFVEEPKCYEIYEDWLKIAANATVHLDPPSELPHYLIPAFTLNGYSVETMAYRNDKTVPSPRKWTQIQEWMTADPHSFVEYGHEGMSVFHALSFMNISGQTGSVIGSITPWVETIALKCGARKIFTLEYQTTTIEGTDRVKYLHPIDFARSWQSFHEQLDFAVSFSSIEHSGLQRYGDPEDPIGDMREVQKVRCSLKKNGLFFLGIPRGQDQLVYNLHRIYGRIRLALLFTGFDLINVFRGDYAQPVELSVKDFEEQLHPSQDVFVLRKV